MKTLLKPLWHLFVILQDLAYLLWRRLIVQLLDFEQGLVTSFHCPVLYLELAWLVVGLLWGLLQRGVEFVLEWCQTILLLQAKNHLVEDVHGHAIFSVHHMVILRFNVLLVEEGIDLLQFGFINFRHRHARYLLLAVLRSQIFRIICLACLPFFSNVQDVILYTLPVRRSGMLLRLR